MTTKLYFSVGAHGLSGSSSAASISARVSSRRARPWTTTERTTCSSETSSISNATWSLTMRLESLEPWAVRKYSLRWWTT